ncbi:Autophagy protein [Saguinus oedipus]|uniref:Autophagy protein n=1 Tax=Saguinus oedipus TaxID=9490 RepID=A0ABQ9V655_SAGOE|nr:Autophagy protein [Saguinus oedipus]
MYWSSFMTSSMQLAKECLNQKLTDEQGEGSQPFEGLEKFAETIETVLRRVKVTFIDTVLRIEHVPENSKTGTALEIRIERTVYCDETADESSGINVHQPTAFAHKLLQLSGVSLFWDEFSASAKSSPVCSTAPVETEPKLSPSWNPKIVYEPHPQLTRNLPEIAPSDPVQIGGLIENSGKIGLANKDRKNRPMQQEEEYRIQMELNRYYLRKDSLSVGVSSEQSFYETETARTPSSREEEVFFSMADMDMSHSLSSLPPLGDPPNMDLELSLTSTYTNTPAGSPLSATVVKSVSVDESRPELIFRLAVGTFSISVLHIDPLSPPETSLNLNPLTPMAIAFFTCIEKIDPARFSTEDFKSFRAMFAEACSHDHLRFIGTGIKVSYEQRQRSAARYFSTDMSIGQMEFLECLFPTDFHSVPPHYTEGNQARLSSVPQKAELQIKLNPVCCELDISIVDRLNSLLQPQKLATVEMMASHMYTSYNKHISLHKAFTEVFLDDSHNPANCRISVQVATPALNLSVRFPIPDLRSDQERGPWFKKSLQKEILHLAFTDLEFKTEFIGGSTPEQIKLELTFRELVGSFQEEKGDPSIKFFHVSSGVDGDTASSDDFDWPRIVLKVNPPAMHSILERIAAEEEEENDGHYQEEEEGGAHSLKDVCDLRRPAPSPFSSRRVMFENEQMVMPGDPVEMTEFQDKAISNSHYVLELTLPNIYITLPNKSFYEKLYNRKMSTSSKSIFNDLLLWEPTAPSPVETFENISYGIGLSVASQLINTFNKDSFSPFKSTVHYDEESGSEEETLQYFSTVDPNYRSRRKKKLDPQNKNSQSFLSVLLNINHGLMAVFTDVKQENGDLLENKHGEFWLEFNSGSLFCVTKYEGFDDKHYICLHSSSFSLYHKGIVDGVILPTETRLPSSTRPHWLEPTIYSSEEDGLSRTSSDGVGGDSLNMLSVAVKILSDKSESNTKEFLIAVGLKGATLQHRMLPSGLSWHEQETLNYVRVMDMGLLELTITAVKSGSDGEQTEPRFELHCSSDVVHIRTCSDSCAALMNLIQYIASYGDLQTPNKAEMKPGAFQRRSKVDSSGRSSLGGPVLPEADQQMLRDLMSDAMEEIDIQQATSSVNPQANGVLDEKCHIQEPCCSDLFLFPDESGNVSQEPGPTYASFSHHFISDAMTGVPTENDDFCILFAPKAAVQEKEEEPVIKIMVDDAIVIRDNYFSLPVTKTDTSKAPLHFPIPVIRYVVKEVSLVWHLYGGKDFGTVPPTSPAKSYISPHSSPSHTPTRHGRGMVCGGKGRNHDFLMEIQLSKVKFQHEVYPPCKPECDSSLSEHPVSRQVFIVQDLEIRDRLATSQMNKFLYLYCSKEMPRKAHSNMLTVKALHVRPESGRSPQECCLRVSLMPLRLNIDQKFFQDDPKTRHTDALFFLKDFFTSLSTEVELLMTPDPEVKKSPGADVTCTLPRHLSTSKEPNLVISFPGPKQPSQSGSANSVEVVNGVEEKNVSAEEASFSDQPVFFRSLLTLSSLLSGLVGRPRSPVLLLSVVTAAQRLSQLEHSTLEFPVSDLFILLIFFPFQPLMGTLAGILIGLAQLNCSELKLKRLSYRHGTDGDFVLTVLVQGLKDLVWLPIEQYRKDGRIVRGLQRGSTLLVCNSSDSSNSFLPFDKMIQAAAETAYDMVSPGTLSIEPKKTKRFPHHRLAHQPVDLREGVAKAYSVVKEGITDTAQTIYETAAREHENRGVTGAVGEVLRQIPPAVVKPLIVATEATSNVLGGMRNQIRPDVRQDESQKWRHGED